MKFIKITEANKLLCLTFLDNYLKTPELFSMEMQGCYNENVTVECEFNNLLLIIWRYKTHYQVSFITKNTQIFSLTAPRGFILFICGFFTKPNKMKRYKLINDIFVYHLLTKPQQEITDNLADLVGSENIKNI